MNMPRLEENSMWMIEIVPALRKEFGYPTLSMQAPPFDKIVINIGMGEAIQNAKAMDNAVRHERHHGPASGHHQGAEFRRIVQAARGHAHRLHRDAARSPHV